MSSTFSLPSRRPSLAILYSNLKAQTDPYEELEDAARLFPMEDDEVPVPQYTIPSVSSRSPTPPFGRSNDDSDSDSDSDSSDSDSDIEPLNLNIDASDAQLDSVMIYTDAPFVPQRQQSPIFTMPFETAPSPKPVFRHSPKPVFRKARSSPRVAPGPSNRSRQRKRAPSPANVDSDRDADSESTGDASDDEYVPSPSLNPRKRTRSASPSSSSLHRTSASPPASSSGSSSGRPNKRARLPPPSRNKQASPAEIKRVVETADDFTDFVCGVCGWVQKNGRLPDFKRHVKTHQRTFDEGSHKGWRCKGVPLDEALNWGVAADAETYTFMGRERVGGCMKTFSRRDALKRHLDNENVSCVGRPTAPTAD